MAPRDPRSRRLVDVVRMGVDDPSSCKGGGGGTGTTCMGQRREGHPSG
jgi:hypothetical protein